eukprot:3596582-Rhodomonas_salina.1
MHEGSPKQWYTVPGTPPLAPCSAIRHHPYAQYYYVLAWPLLAYPSPVPARRTRSGAGGCSEERVQLSP